MLAVLTLAALAAGFAWTGADVAAAAATRAGADLTMILRLMVALKTTLAAVLVGAIAWRLAMPASTGWLAAYFASAAIMAAGIGPTWHIAHLIAGVSMLHVGLIASAVLLWRDPGVARKLAERLRFLDERRR